MPLSFAGIPLLLEDPDGAVSEFLDHFIPFEDIRHVAEYPAGVRNSLPGISQPNYARPLRPKINTWYSPTGASRWSMGFLLVDGARKAQIAAAGGVGTLQLYDPTIQGPFGTRGSGIAIPNCIALPPHPVSANNNSPTSLWIVPIVDNRYQWQFNSFQVNLPAINIAAPFISWTDLISATLTTLGIGSTPYPTPSANYLSPNQWAFTRQAWQSTAVMLDVMLASVGMRLVPQNSTLYGPAAASTITGYAIQDVPTAQAVLANNFATDTTPALQVGTYGSAAADGGPIAPSSVNVVFKSWINGIKLEDDLVSRYSIVTTASQVNWTSLVTNGPQHTVRSAAMANYTQNGFPSAYSSYQGNSNSPDNAATLLTLAQQISQDLYGWLSAFQDQTCISITQRLQTGFEDYWEYSCGRRREDGSYEQRSRVHFMPHNFFCDDLLHWDSTTTCATYYFPNSPTPSTPGSGYYEGDIVSPTSGTNYVVTAVDSSGAITSLGLPYQATQGSAFRAEFPTGPSAPPYVSPKSLTGGQGSGAQVSDTWTGVQECNLIWEFGSVITGVLQGDLSALGTQYILIDYADVQFPSPYYLLVTEDNNNNYVTGTTVTAIKDGTVWTVVSAGVQGVVSDFLLGSTAAIVVAKADGTQTGTFKVSDGTTKTATVRRGVCLKKATYWIASTPSGFEVVNPTLSGIGKTNAAIGKGTSGTVNIYTGTLGSETASGSTLTAWNRYADVAITKWVRWAWNDDSSAFDLAAAEC